MADLIDAATDELLSAIDRLKQKGAEFAAAYNQFVANYDVISDMPDLVSEWNMIKSYADTVKNTVSWINNAVDSAANWFKSAFGFSGLNAVGAIPLIPIAYVTAALAALTYAIGRMVEFNAKVDLVRANKLPGSALTDSNGPLADASSLAKWIVIGAAAYFLLPQILKRWK